MPRSPGDVTVRVHGPVHLAWAAGLGARERVLETLLGLLGTPDETVAHLCATCGSSDHGALRTDSGASTLSLTHAGELVVGAAVSTTVAASVGVDVEVDHDEGPLRELEPLFAPLPAPSILEWTAIEAVVKADGRGLRIAPGDVVLTAEPGTVLPRSVRAILPDRTGIEVATAPAPAGHAVSVAIDPVPGSAR